LILAIAFGLSTDYEVFLLSRIREHWLASGDAQAAVENGLAASARTISSAAFILVCVFGVFVGTAMPAIKEIGLGAAVAIGLDATVVRLMLVPALMSLLGEISWWVPRWLRSPATPQAVTATSTVPTVYSAVGD
jgi:RND superfamily putative drug exporter